MKVLLCHFYFKNHMFSLTHINSLQRQSIFSRLHFPVQKNAILDDSKGYSAQKESFHPEILQQLTHTGKKDGAKTVPFGNRFEKWCPF